MQSSMVVAGIDALSESCENILTRRANQRHYSIIAQFAKRHGPARQRALRRDCRQKSLPTIEVAPARRSEGTPLALPSRAHFRCASPRTLDETRPLACFAGIWTNWTSVRKVEDAVIASRY